MQGTVGFHRTTDGCTTMDHRMQRFFQPTTRPWFRYTGFYGMFLSGEQNQDPNTAKTKTDGSIPPTSSSPLSAKEKHVKLVLPSALISAIKGKGKGSSSAQPTPPGPAKAISRDIHMLGTSTSGGQKRGREVPAMAIKTTPSASAPAAKSELFATAANLEESTSSFRRLVAHHAETVQSQIRIRIY